MSFPNERRKDLPIDVFFIFYYQYIVFEAVAEYSVKNNFNNYFKQKNLLN